MAVYQAIVTKYIGPRNVRGLRVKATAQAGSKTIEWDDALNSEDNHMVAAENFAAKLDWKGDWHMGALPDGRYVFVCANNSSGGSDPAFVIR